MDILDYEEPVKKKSGKNVYFLLGGMIIVSLILQIDAVYWEQVFRKAREHNSSFLMCFYGPYLNRLAVEFLTYSSLLISFIVVAKSGWSLPEMLWKRLVLFSPVGVLLIDQVLVIFYF